MNLLKNNNNKFLINNYINNINEKNNDKNNINEKNNDKNNINNNQVKKEEKEIESFQGKNTNKKLNNHCMNLNLKKKVYQKRKKKKKKIMKKKFKK